MAKKISAATAAPAVNTLRDKFIAVQKDINGYFVERRDVTLGLTIAFIAQKNILLVGSPGVAKSKIVDALTDRIIGATKFDWLLGKFTTPNEIYGPYNVKLLGEGIYRRVTTNMASEAHIIFYDECYKGNSAILNTNLKLMNEKKFYDNGESVKSPLITLVGASNEVPEKEDALDALHDRFHLKFVVKPILESSNFMRMMASEDSFGTGTTITLDELKRANAEAMALNFNDETMEVYHQLWQSFKSGERISVTDRTMMASKSVARAQAWLRGHAEVLPEDLDILRHMLWQDPKHERDVSSTVLQLVAPERAIIMENLDALRLDVDKIHKEKTANKRMTATIDLLSKNKEIIKIINDKMLVMKAKKLETQDLEDILAEAQVSVAKFTRELSQQ